MDGHKHYKEHNKPYRVKERRVVMSESVAVSEAVASHLSARARALTAQTAHNTGF